MPRGAAAGRGRALVPVLVLGMVLVLLLLLPLWTPRLLLECSTGELQLHESTAGLKTGWKEWKERGHQCGQAIDGGGTI